MMAFLTLLCDGKCGQVSVSGYWRYTAVSCIVKKHGNMLFFSACSRAIALVVEQITEKLLSLDGKLTVGAAVYKVQRMQCSKKEFGC